MSAARTVAVPQPDATGIGDANAIWALQFAAYEAMLAAGHAVTPRWYVHAAQELLCSLTCTACGAASHVYRRYGAATHTFRLEPAPGRCKGGSS